MSRQLAQLKTKFLSLHLPTSSHRNDGSYQSWSWSTRSGSYVGGDPEYNYDVFVSYARLDEKAAAQVAETLVTNGLRVFFALKSFPAVGVVSASSWGPDSPYGWSGPLEDALLSSRHFLGLLTRSYASTPWCDLEYLAFRSIRLQNHKRKLFLLTPDKHFELPPLYGAYDALVSSEGAAIDLVLHADAPSGPKLGQAIFPRECFFPLPLRSISFPYGYPWDDSEQGTIYEPPYRPFAALVRELMVRLRKGAQEQQLLEDLEKLEKWRRHAGEALYAAKVLLERGIGPEGVPGIENGSGLYSPVTSSEGPQAASRDLPTPEAQLLLSSPPSPIARATEPVWDTCRAEGPSFVLEATCRRCGYSEQFCPPAGDMPYPACPRCGYDGSGSSSR